MAALLIVPAPTEAVRHTGLEPQTSRRPQTALLLTRLSLALGRSTSCTASSRRATPRYSRSSRHTNKRSP
eukprot:scaffold95105_cov54-Phaeocystis_antarctica.AAC.2